MVDRRNFFDQRIKNDWRTYDNIQKISTCQGDDDYTTWCLLDYPYFDKYYNLIAIDLNKQQKLDADSKAIRKINFTGNQDETEDATKFFNTEEAKEIILDFFTTNHEATIIL